MPGALASQPFLRIEDVVFPTPWSAVAALAMLLGLAWLGWRLARQVRASPTALEVAAGFLTATAAVAAVVQALGLASLATVGALRTVASLLVVAGAGWLTRPARQWLVVRRADVASCVRDAALIDRWLLVSSALSLLLLGLGSLGPPTDIDTLAYHLSVPLDWLADQAIHPAPEWLCARLVGAGEALNLLGLGAGSDCFGSALQAAGLVAATAAASSIATTPRNRALTAAVVAGCPAGIYLALTAKPQLLPAAASATALALFISCRDAQFRTMSRGTVWMLFTCSSFAVASKYSFLPGGVAIAMLVLWSLRGTPWMRTAVVALPTTLSLLALPVLVRNVVFYGDPLSPLLEPLRADPDPAVVAFRWYLRNFAGDHSLARLLHLPWDLVVATGPGQLTTVLGLGAVAGLTIPRPHWRTLGVLSATAAVLVASVGGQLQARFFFEPYLWFALVAASAPWTRRKQLLATALGIQMLVTVPVAAYGAWRLLPAAATTRDRESALVELAADYELSRWLDRTLPPDATLATDRHASLFAPRRATHADYVRMLQIVPDQATAARRVAELVAGSRATFLLVTEPVESSPFANLAAELGPPVARSPPFRDAVRNPWQEGHPYRVRLYRLGTP